MLWSVQQSDRNQNRRKTLTVTVIGSGNLHKGLLMRQTWNTANAYVHSVPQQVSHFHFCDNFGKYGLIFIIYFFL